MGQSDGNRLALHASHSSPLVASTPGAALALHRGEGEPFTSHLSGDPGDGPLASWENAWIDVGGEG